MLAPSSKATRLRPQDSPRTQSERRDVLGPVLKWGCAQDSTGLECDLCLRALGSDLALPLGRGGGGD